MGAVRLLIPHIGEPLMQSREGSSDILIGMNEADETGTEMTRHLVPESPDVSSLPITVLLVLHRKSRMTPIRPQQNELSGCLAKTALSRQQISHKSGHQGFGGFHYGSEKIFHLVLSAVPLGSEYLFHHLIQILGRTQLLGQ